MENLFFIFSVVFVSIFCTTMLYRNAFLAFICLQPIGLLVVLVVSQYTSNVGFAFYAMCLSFLAILNIMALWFLAQMNFVKLKKDADSVKERIS